MGVKLILNNNEFYQNAMINIRSDNDEWKNAAGTCSTNLIEKTITENGEYKAKEDEADGYSEVTVNISSTSTLYSVGLNESQYKLPSRYQMAIRYVSLIAPDSNGTVDTGSKGNANYDGALCIIPTPVKLITGKISKSAYKVVFTPADDFLGISIDSQYCTPSGSVEITPGDGQIYDVIVDAGYKMYTAEIIGHI